MFVFLVLCAVLMRILPEILASVSWFWIKIILLFWGGKNSLSKRPPNPKIPKTLVNNWKISLKNIYEIRGLNKITLSSMSSELPTFALISHLHHPCMSCTQKKKVHTQKKELIIPKIISLSIFGKKNLFSWCIFVIIVMII